MKPLRTTGAIVILLAAMGLLGWRLMTAGGPEPYPDTEKSTTAWMCAGCGKLVLLTARQQHEWTLSADRVRHGQPSGPMIPGAQQTVFWCDACQTYSLVRARECPRHHVWYIVRDPDGKLVGCPKCAAASGD